LREKSVRCACVDHDETVDRVVHLLEAVKRIGLEDLERMVQQAHECDTHQITEPLEPFPVTRQALRMFWRFRCHLESVEVMAAHG
jgi:hypothetical protein